MEEPQELQDRSSALVERLINNTMTDPETDLAVHALSAIRYAAMLGTFLNIPLDLMRATLVVMYKSSQNNTRTFPFPPSPPTGKMDS